jgi:hypothetical protein
MASSTIRQSGALTPATAQRAAEPEERLRVLLLADDRPDHAPTLLEHIRALRRYSSHDVRVFNPRGQSRSRTLDLAEFDAVVIHYSLMILSDAYLSPDLRSKIAAFDGVKVQFIQDDYRHVNEMWKRMRELGIDVLFTLVPERELDKVWPESELPGVRRITTLAGFLPEEAIRAFPLPLDARPLDVGYRGRALPPWLGILGQEKAWIAQGVQSRSETHGLRSDVAWSETARIYGQAWFDFIESCRVTLGTESGATITDFDGSIERETLEFIERHPDADFWEVHRSVLAPYEGNVRMNVISPRIFEAIALGTGLVLFPGEYSGVLEPDRHYIVLDKDFGNFDDVVDQIRDTASLQARIDRTRAEILPDARYSYRGLGRSLDDALREAGASVRRRGSAHRYHAALVERRLRATRVASPRTIAYAAVRRAATTRLIVDDREVRALAGDYLTRSELRRAAPARSVAADLTRLAASRRAHRGKLETAPGFTVVALQDEETEGTRLVSVATGTTATAERAETVTFPLRWSHRPVGESVVVPLNRWHWVTVPVGVHGGPEHQFEALAALADVDPEAVQRAVAELSAAPTQPSRTRTEPKRLPLPLHILRHGSHYARKAAHLYLLMRRYPALRHLLHSAVSGSAAAQVPPRAIVADVLLLEALRGAARGRVVGVEALDASLEDGVVTIQSRRRRRTAALPHVEGAPLLRWDHSEVDRQALLETEVGVVSYGLLPVGVHEFSALQDAVESGETWLETMYYETLTELGLRAAHGADPSTDLALSRP